MTLKEKLESFYKQQIRYIILPMKSKKTFAFYQQVLFSDKFSEGQYLLQSNSPIDMDRVTDYFEKNFDFDPETDDVTLLSGKNGVKLDMDA